jgi:hypothetical protein
MHYFQPQPRLSVKLRRGQHAQAAAAAAAAAAACC